MILNNLSKQKGVLVGEKYKGVNITRNHEPLHNGLTEQSPVPDCPESATIYEGIPT